MPAWLIALDRHFPIRYLTVTLAAVAAMLGCFAWVAFDQMAWLALLGVAAFALGVRDLVQTSRALLRNYPIIGHIRYLLEWVRPEIRQYFLESDREAIEWWITCVYRRALYTQVVLRQPMVRGSMGQPVVNPLEATVARLTRDIDQAADRFGMTTLARFRLHFEAQGFAEDPDQQDAEAEYREMLGA